MSNNLVSAVMAYYKGAKCVREAVGSIARQVDPPCELIIVDDGDPDGGPKKHLRGLDLPFPLRIVRKENGGQSSARNVGIRMSQGEYIALCDQDDTWYPEHVKYLCGPLRGDVNKRVGWVYSNWSEIDASGGLVATGYLDGLPLEHPKSTLGHILGAGIIIQPGAAIFRKSAIEDAGYFDQKLSGYEDDDLFLRIFRRQWANIYLPGAHSTWRIYGESSQFSRRTVESRRYYAKKLMATYPDDVLGGRYWTRDCIAPRFYRIAEQEYERALAAGNDEACRELVADMREYASHTSVAFIGRKERWRMNMRQNPRRFKAWRARLNALPHPVRRVIRLSL